jgi:hypothetical protein
VGFEVLTAVVLKSSTFWDITSCSPLKVNRHFGGPCLFHLQGRRISRGDLCLPSALALAFLWRILLSLIWSRHVPPKRLFTFNGVHGVISRKKELSTVNLCIHAQYTRLFHAQYDKWCNRGSRERASQHAGSRGKVSRSYSGGCWFQSRSGLNDTEFGVRVPVEARFFFFLQCPGGFWGLPSLLSNG